MSISIPTYEKGATIKLLVTYKDFDGSLSDVDGLAYISIYDSDNNLEVTTASMSHSTTGVYYYDWVPTVEDMYVAEFTGDINAKAAKKRFKFRVKETRLE